MKKNRLPILIIVVLMSILFACIIVLRNGRTVMSNEEAEEILRNYLINNNQWEEDYILEAIDPIVRKIDNDYVYCFELRYKNTVEEVGSRLIGNYAITVDGNTFFWYDSANDEWIVQKCI